MASHSSTHAWKIPWAEEEPGRLQPMGLRRVGHDWATSLSLFPFMHWRKKWQPTPVFLPGESQGWGSLVGCRLWGRIESDTTWSNLAAAAVWILLIFIVCLCPGFTLNRALFWCSSFIYSNVLSHLTPRLPGPSLISLFLCSTDFPDYTGNIFRLFPSPFYRIQVVATVLNIFFFFMEQYVKDL